MISPNDSSPFQTHTVREVLATLQNVVEQLLPVIYSYSHGTDSSEDRDHIW